METYLQKKKKVEIVKKITKTVVMTHDNMSTLQVS